MDLRVFYQKMRAIEQQIPTQHVLVVSLETPDGGKAGVQTEVKRELAAKLIVENRARLATADEAEAYRAAHESAAKEHERKELAQRLAVNIVSDEELKAIRKSRKDQ